MKKFCKKCCNGVGLWYNIIDRKVMERKTMTKTITIHNSKETFVLIIKTIRGMYQVSVNGGEFVGCTRRGMNNQEIIDWNIKCYAEPNAVVYVR